MPAPQGRYFLLTIPHQDFLPFLPPGLSSIKGQLERGASGYLHWQVLVSYPKKVTAARVKETFGSSCHVELSRSAAAEEYVWKEDSRVGHQFELGTKALKWRYPELDQETRSALRRRFTNVVHFN